MRWWGRWTLSVLGEGSFSAAFGSYFNTLPGSALSNIYTSSQGTASSRIDMVVFASVAQESQFISHSMCAGSQVAAENNVIRSQWKDLQLLPSVRAHARDKHPVG